MLSVPPQYVKRGLWINVEDGPVMGRTITTDVRTGNIVIALLAIITAFGVAHFWNLINFAYHQCNTKRHPADGLFRQHQALLRTLPPPGSMFSECVKLWWIWRKRTDKAFIRLLPQLFLGMVFTVITIVVGIFASYVVSTSNIKVLVESPHCRPIPFRMNGLEGYSQKIQTLGRQYTEECYQESDNQLPLELCNAFVQPRIRFSHERVQCPFNVSICANVTLPGLALDSGLLDVNDALGINLANKERIKFRRKSHCGIIECDGHYSILSSSNVPPIGRSLQPGEEFMGWHFGTTPTPGLENITFIHSLLESNISAIYSTDGVQHYNSPLLEPWNNFNPIAELENHDADVFFVLIIKDNVRYMEAVDDPVFSAHKTVPSTAKSGLKGEIYVSDFPVSGLNCHVQYQFCFKRSNNQDFCTDLGGLPGSVSQEHFLGANELQLSVIRHLVKISHFFDINSGSTNLKVAELLTNWGTLRGLPKDQWVQEVIAWESAVWAAIQISSTDYALGFELREPGVFNLPQANLTMAEKQLCGMQRMRNPGGFVNINVFGLAFTITFCGVVMVVDIVLLKFLIFLRRFRRALAPCIDAWIQDGFYQLQRRAYEAHGRGQWERLDKEIPVTMERTDLQDLPLESVPTNPPGRPLQYECKCGDTMVLVEETLNTPTGAPMEASPVGDNDLSSVVSLQLGSDNSTLPVDPIHETPAQLAATQLAATQPADSQSHG